MIRNALALTLVLGFCLATAAQAAPCESLQKLVLPDTTIVSATLVPAGPFATPSRVNTPPRPLMLPAMCRVVGRIPPAITFEVWMPAANWNGKFQAVGGGGFAGVISYGAMAAAVGSGYATASTDTGHSTPGGAWALDRPDLVVDFAYRAIHEMTVKSKAIVAAFYGNVARRSYFVGCSTGGRQGLMEAQRFPSDYDGIVAGAPANYWTRLMSAGLLLASATLKDSASRIWHAQYALLNKAVMAACDGRDGIRDGLIANPERCNFDPKVLQCAGAAAEDCLTAAQVESARKMYGPILISRTKQEVFPGLARGSERDWHVLAGGPGPFPIVVDFYKYFVHGNPDWDWNTFDNHLDVSTADARFGKLMNAVDANLRPFKDRGGKLILYHGWNDDRISPFNTINYYNSVRKEMGAGATDEFVRLFMAPGMLHCAAAAPGPNTFDAVGAVDQWVEKAVKPDKLIASHSTGGVVDRTRPLCPYPQVATYRGTGSTEEAASFVCK